MAENIRFSYEEAEKILDYWFSMEFSSLRRPSILITELQRGIYRSIKRERTGDSRSSALSGTLTMRRQVEKSYRESLKAFQDSDMDSAPVLDEAYVRKLYSADIADSAKAQVENPWFTQRYNRERENQGWQSFERRKGGRCDWNADRG